MIKPALSRPGLRTGRSLKAYMGNMLNMLYILSINIFMPFRFPLAPDGQAVYRKKL